MDTHKLAYFIVPLSLTLCLFFIPTLSRVELPGQYSITGVDPETHSSELQIRELFQQWMERYGKTYHGVEEMEKRFENFKGNLRHVEGRNSKRVGHTVGLNRFADLSNQEFREMHLGKVKKRVGLKTRRSSEPVCDPPRSLDWRKKGVVTPVKDQGTCGSCWAFSATGAIEGINAITKGELVSLSEQELINCDYAELGCKGGSIDGAFEWVIQNGLDTEKDYPYKADDGACDINKVVNKKNVTIDDYVDLVESEMDLLCATIKQPISVGIVGSSIDFQLYTGGIFEGDYCSSDPADINHAALIVGYGSEMGMDYWIVKNSWGKHWGMDGYMHIRRNTDLPFGVCAVNAMASFPLQTSSSMSPFPSPSTPPPPPSPSLPPPTPHPSDCGEFTYCPPGQTCCCLFGVYDVCMIYGCCPYIDAVCCAGTDTCCPQEYPICDLDEGLCLKEPDDEVGVTALKKKLAKYKLPWSKYAESEEMNYQILQLRRTKRFAVAR